MKLPQPIDAWYSGLGKRDQRLVVVGLVLVVLLILYLAVINPLVSAHQSLARRVAADRSLLVYMNSVAERLRVSNARSSAHPVLTGSVFSAVSAAARGSSISNAVQRLEQANNGGVRVTLSAVRFDALVRWLDKLASEKGIVVNRATIQGAQAPGTVDASLTLNVRS